MCNCVLGFNERDSNKNELFWIQLKNIYRIVFQYSLILNGDNDHDMQSIRKITFENENHAKQYERHVGASKAKNLRVKSFWMLAKVRVKSKLYEARNYRGKTSI